MRLPGRRRAAARRRRGSGLSGAARARDLQQRGVERDLAPAARAAALEAMEAAYAAAGVERFAAWTHEPEVALRAELLARGYRVTECTRAMGMPLDAIALPPPATQLLRSDWPDYLAYLRAAGLPAGLLGGVDPTPFHALAAWVDGANVATALALDHRGDRGLYNLSTLEQARRRARHRAHRAPAPQRRGTGLFDREPAVDGDGRTHLRRRWDSATSAGSSSISPARRMSGQRS